MKTKSYVIRATKRNKGRVTFRTKVETPCSVEANRIFKFLTETYEQVSVAQEIKTDIEREVLKRHRS